MGLRKVLAKLWNLNWILNRGQNLDRWKRERIQAMALQQAKTSGSCRVSPGWIKAFMLTYSDEVSEMGRDDQHYGASLRG